MVLAAGDRVERLNRGEEVAGDELGALVDQLVEGVLAVRAGLSPDDGLHEEHRVSSAFETLLLGSDDVRQSGSRRGCRPW